MISGFIIKRLKKSKTNKISTSITSNELRSENQVMTAVKGMIRLTGLPSIKLLQIKF